MEKPSHEREGGGGGKGKGGEGRRERGEGGIIFDFYTELSCVHHYYVM